MTPEEIQALLDGCVCARLLAVRNPTIDADTLAHLLCDQEPKIREWAAVHPNLAKSDDWRVRLFVVRNPNTSSTTVIQLTKDAIEEVQLAARNVLRMERR